MQGQPYPPTDIELRNHAILITGGTSGFGYEFARQLLALGNTVLITGRNPARLADTKRRLPQVHTFQSDVSDPAAIQQLAEQIIIQFPTLDVLINNAGEMRKLNLQAPLTDLRDLTREIDTNLAGPIRMVQQFLPQLRAQKAAAILNVTSCLNRGMVQGVFRPDLNPEMLAQLLRARLSKLLDDEQSWPEVTTSKYVFPPLRQQLMSTVLRRA